MKKQKTLVVFSGGQDSTTCIMWAIKKYGRENVETITFDYGSRHNIELKCAKKITQKLRIKNFVYKIDVLKWNKNALTDSKILVKETKTVPTTFVPYRNMHFLLIAATYAQSKNITNIVTGVCETDFSGYKDCRDIFIKSLNVTLNLAGDYQIIIHTPLMWLNKAKTVKLMIQLKGYDLLKYTHTCYEGKRPACGKCPACKLRLRGFKKAGVCDPLEYK